VGMSNGELAALHLASRTRGVLGTIILKRCLKRLRNFAANVAPCGALWRRLAPRGPIYATSIPKRVETRSIYRDRKQTA
jgi:hypothetical protein